MAKQDVYNELIFQLGDLARERLARHPQPPRSLERVFRAEQGVLERRAELAALEHEMNDRDADFQSFVARAAEERKEDEHWIKRFKRDVDAVQSRAKELRKKLAALRADHRYAQKGLLTAEEKHRELESSARFDAARLSASKENLKKLRLAQMRRGRELEELEEALARALTPEEGDPAAEGILAWRRTLEREDEAVRRKEELDAALAELDAAVAAKEEELNAAEDFLDQAVFVLGEECYVQRFADPALSALYPKLDKVAR